MSNENENVINQLGTFLVDAFRMRNQLMQSWWTPDAPVSHIFILRMPMLVHAYEWMNDLG